MGVTYMLVHQFSTRQRLANANGHTENHVMQIGGRWGFSEQSPDLGELFGQMDDWLIGIRNDRSASDLAEKVRAHKPAGLTDACWREPEAPLSELELAPDTDAGRQRLNSRNPIEAAESAYALSSLQHSAAGCRSPTG